MTGDWVKRTFAWSRSVYTEVLDMMYRNVCFGVSRGRIHNCGQCVKSHENGCMTN